MVTNDPQAIAGGPFFFALRRNPGWYKKGIKVSNGKLILGNGGSTTNAIYYIGDGTDTTGFNINNTTMDASAGVMIYIASGAFTFPSGSFNISAMSSGTYAQVAIFQSRTDSAGAQINGAANVTLNGALYFSDNAVTLPAPGAFRAPAISSSPTRSP